MLTADGGAAPVLGDQLRQGRQMVGDVGERHRLQDAPAPDRLLVQRDGLLGRLPRRGELEQEPLAVEVLDGGDAAGVGIGPQVAPLDQLVQRLGEPPSSPSRRSSAATPSGRRWTMNRSLARPKASSTSR